MPSSLRHLAIALLGATAYALPSGPRLTEMQKRYHELSRRQNKAAATAGLGDLDILQL